MIITDRENTGINNTELLHAVDLEFWIYNALADILGETSCSTGVEAGLTALQDHLLYGLV